MSQITTFITKRCKLVAVCASVTFCVGASNAFAQERNNLTDQIKAASEQGGQISLALDDVDIRVLISTVAEVSGKNFIVDSRVKGKVSVISGATLDAEQLYDVFLSILEVNNYAAVDSGNVIKILPSNVIKQRPTPLLFSPSEESNDAQITQIIQLKHAPVQDLVPIIRPLIPPTSHFAPHVPSNSVVITDTRANIQRVLQIIRSIDIPDKRSNISVISLNFAKASELAATLTQLVTSTADPKDAAAAGRISIQPFDSINSLVISAPEDQYDKIEALIDELDILREVEGNVNVIPLKHAKAEDLATLLRDIAGGGGGEGTAGAAFSVQADEASNSLIVNASGAQLSTVRSVVNELDKRRAQVFVETIIAEVSLDQSAELGINWNIGGARGEDTTTTDADGVATTVAGTTGNLIDTNRPGLPAATIGGGQAFDISSVGANFALFDLGRFQLDVIINAIASDTNSNILSTPTILTLDNEEAEIIVGQEVPFVTGTFNNGFDTATDGDGTAADGGLTVGTGFQTIERRDVGISLRIKPQINEGDTIQLEVLQETSSLSPAVVAGVSGGVITNRRSIEAVVQVDDGQIVALGGLISDNISDTVSKVPFLGDIPLLGNLFRSKEKRAQKSNLMVFLKPHIVRTPQQLATFSKSKYQGVRRDNIIAARQNPSFIIKDSAAPILVDYEASLEDNFVGSERRAKLAKEGVPKTVVQKVTGVVFNKRVKNIIFGRKDKNEEGSSESEFETGGDIEADSQIIETIEPEAAIPEVVEPKKTPGGIFDIDDEAMESIIIDKETAGDNQ